MSAANSSGVNGRPQTRCYAGSLRRTQVPAHVGPPAEQPPAHGASNQLSSTHGNSQSGSRSSIATSSKAQAKAKALIDPKRDQKSAADAQALAPPKKDDE